MTHPAKVGFIGLGVMGEPIAANLLRSGIPLMTRKPTRRLARRIGVAYLRGADAGQQRVVLRVHVGQRLLYQREPPNGLAKRLAVLRVGGGHVQRQAAQRVERSGESRNEERGRAECSQQRHQCGRQQL